MKKAPFISDASKKQYISMLRKYILPVFGERHAGVDAMVAMKIVGHTDYRTTANIYTHLDEETLIHIGMSLDAVFEKKKWEPSRGNVKINAQAQILAIGK